MKNPIPPSRSEDVLHMYWVLLTALESRIEDNESAVLDRDAVLAGYQILNDIGYTKARPSWEKRKKRSPRVIGPVEFENAELGDEG